MESCLVSLDLRLTVKLQPKEKLFKLKNLIIKQAKLHLKFQIFQINILNGFQIMMKIKKRMLFKLIPQIHKSMDLIILIKKMCKEKTVLKKRMLQFSKFLSNNLALIKRILSKYWIKLKIYNKMLHFREIIYFKILHNNQSLKITQIRILS